MFTKREFKKGEVIGLYTGRVFYATDGDVRDCERLVSISAARHGAAATTGHVVVPSEFGYISGSKHSYATYAQDGGRAGSSVSVNAYLQEVENDGAISVRLVTLEAIPASSEVFIEYGTGYYNSTPPRAIPGSRDVRLLPVWKAFELMHCKVKEVMKKSSERP